MTNEEKIRLVLETLGVDNVKQATKAIRDLDSAVEEVADDMAILGDSIKSGVEKPMERFLVTLKDGRKVWNDSAEGLKQLGVVAGRDGKFGSSMLTAAFFVDDLQYCFIVF
jgi:hypothetical protein